MSPPALHDVLWQHCQPSLTLKGWGSLDGDSHPVPRCALGQNALAGAGTASMYVHTQSRARPEARHSSCLSMASIPDCAHIPSGQQ